jgi:hypothetical protein
MHDHRVARSVACLLVVHLDSSRFARSKSALEGRRYEMLREDVAPAPPPLLLLLLVMALALVVVMALALLL